MIEDVWVRYLLSFFLIIWYSWTVAFNNSLKIICRWWTGRMDSEDKSLTQAIHRCGIHYSSQLFLEARPWSAHVHIAPIRTVATWDVLIKFRESVLLYWFITIGLKFWFCPPHKTWSIKHIGAVSNLIPEILWPLS